MHGTTMVFLAIMPLNTGLGNFIVPLMVGANDMAYPRLNALSLWLFVGGGIFLTSSWVLGGAPDAGWFAYPPVSSSQPYASTTNGMDFWILGVNITGIASIMGALNFIVTIFNLRAPGMRFNRMPLFVWAQLVTSFLLIFALPAVTVALGDAVLRPQLRYPLLRAVARRRPVVVATSVLVLRPPRSVYHDLAAVRRDLRSAAGLFAQADLRLRVYRLFQCCDRLSGLYRVGAPYVRRRNGPAGQRGFFGYLDADRGAHRRQDLQLDRHVVGRLAEHENAAVLRGRVHLPVYHRRHFAA